MSNVDKIGAIIKLMFTDPKKNVLEFGFIPGQRVVDLGSGAGHYSLALSHALGEAGKVVAIDIDKPLLSKLKNESMELGQTNVDVLDGNIEKLGGVRLRDAYADGVVFSNILFQLNSIPTALEEAKRVLKPGGKACVVEWTDLTMLTGKKDYLQGKAIPEVDTKKFFEKAGFVFERSFNAGEKHYGLIFKKPLQ